jgi:hypothetical protein
MMDFEGREFCYMSSICIPLNRNDAFGCGLRSRALYYFPRAFPLTA